MIFCEYIHPVFFILYNDQQMRNYYAQLFNKFSHSYMFRHYRVILREFVINTLPSYTYISNAVVGNTIVLPTAAFEIFV